MSPITGSKSDLFDAFSSNYEDVASEYYDHDRHPTCKNYTEASRAFVARHIPPNLSGTFVDVGAGRSILCELLSSSGRDLGTSILVDSSASMLAYSDHYALRGAKLVVADASAIPLKRGISALIIASLGDPYNTRAFWREVARCLSPNGCCIFTTPSHEWTTSFRQLAPKEREASAHFELRDGRSLYLPSGVLPVRKQIELIEASGLCVDHVEAISAAELSVPISPKLKTAFGIFPNPLTGYRVVQSHLS
jgi:ubiquinone/menaquinone biosynthesis C-methylase UbiE